MASEIDLSQFWCCNEECPDYGKQNHGNIIIKQRYGKDNRALLKCRTCKDYFSETRGTAFFGLDTPREEVIRACLKIKLNYTIVIEFMHLS